MALQEIKGLFPSRKTIGKPKKHKTETSAHKAFYNAGVCNDVRRKAHVPHFFQELDLKVPALCKFISLSYCFIYFFSRIPFHYIAPNLDPGFTEASTIISSALAELMRC